MRETHIKDRFVSSFGILTEDSDIDYTLTQYLQKKVCVKILCFRVHYWKTIDSEIVPSFAWIQANTLGSTEWESKFSEHIK